MQKKRALRKDVQIIEEGTTHQKEHIITRRRQLRLQQNTKNKHEQRKERLLQRKTTGQYDVPIKFFTDSGSPVTLIPNCLFNNKSQVEPLLPTYRDVNKGKIDFIVQTQAKVKTNNETIKLLLVITKATATPLMVLDWMQRLGINMNTVNSGIEIQNIQLDETKRKIMQPKISFKNLL